MASVRTSESGQETWRLDWRENIKFALSIGAVGAIFVGGWYGLKGDQAKTQQKVDSHDQILITIDKKLDKIAEHDAEKLTLLNELKITAEGLKANVRNNDSRLERIERKQDQDRADKP